MTPLVKGTITKLTADAGIIERDGGVRYPFNKLSLGRGVAFEGLHVGLDVVFAERHGSAPRARQVQPVPTP